VAPDLGWWLWFTCTLLFSAEVWGLAWDAASLLLAAELCVCLLGCGYHGVLGDNPALFPLVTLVVLGAHK